MKIDKSDLGIIKEELTQLEKIALGKASAFFTKYFKGNEINFLNFLLDISKDENKEQFYEFVNKVNGLTEDTLSKIIEITKNKINSIQIKEEDNQEIEEDNQEIKYEDFKVCKFLMKRFNIDIDDILEKISDNDLEILEEEFKNIKYKNKKESFLRENSILQLFEENIEYINFEID